MKLNLNNRGRSMDDRPPKPPSPPRVKRLSLMPELLPLLLDGRKNATVRMANRQNIKTGDIVAVCVAKTNAKGKRVPAHLVPAAESAAYVEIKEAVEVRWCDAYDAIEYGTITTGKSGPWYEARYPALDYDDPNCTVWLFRFGKVEPRYPNDPDRAAQERMP